MTSVRPQGRYRTAIRSGAEVCTAGITPRIEGRLVWRGAVGSDISVDDARAAAALATVNALAAARGALSEGERIDRCLSLTVFINAAPDFEQHAHVADAASDVVAETLGADGMGVRAAVGVSSLPGGASVEIQFSGLVTASGARRQSTATARKHPTA